MSKQSTYSRGFTLIELILYSGLLITLLTVFYQFFAISGFQKLAKIVENELLSNGQHALFEIQKEVYLASSIDEPTLGIPSDRLSLDGGSVVFSLVGGKIFKTKGAVSEPITDNYVVVNQLEFLHLGPSVDSPTVSIRIGMEAYKPVEGRLRTETFESSASIR